MFKLTSLVVSAVLYASAASAAALWANDSSSSTSASWSYTSSLSTPSPDCSSSSSSSAWSSTLIFSTNVTTSTPSASQSAFEQSSISLAYFPSISTVPSTSTLPPLSIITTASAQSNTVVVLPPSTTALPVGPSLPPQPKPTAAVNQTVLTNDNPAFVYDPPNAWQNVSTGVPSCAASSQLKVTNQTNATITFNFTGTLLRINAITSNAGGVFGITINNQANLTQTIDTFAAGLVIPSCTNFNVSSSTSAISSAIGAGSIEIDLVKLGLLAGGNNAQAENQAQLKFHGGLPQNQQASGITNSQFSFDSATIQNDAAASPSSSSSSSTSASSSTSPSPSTKSSSATTDAKITGQLNIFTSAILVLLVCRLL